MGADLLELLGRQRPRLREDVLGHGQLADVVQQRGRLDALDFVLAHPEAARERGGVELHAADVQLRGLVLRVDRERQRFDRRQVQVRHLLRVPALVLDAPEIDLVAVVRQIQRRQRGTRRAPSTAAAAVVIQRRRRRRRQGADEVARRAPEEVLVPDLEERLLHRQRDRRRDGEAC